MPQSTLLSGIKVFARHSGVGILWFRPESSEGDKLALLSSQMKTDSAFNVGADRSHDVGHLDAWGYQRRVKSFEPPTAAHAELRQVSRCDLKWTVHPCCIVSVEYGRGANAIASNTGSSCALPMLEEHAQASPHSRYVWSEGLGQQQRDDVAAAYTAQAQNTCLKVDTLAFESAVLEGESELLAICCSGPLDKTFVPLYGSQKLWIYFHHTMLAQGFDPLAWLDWIDPAIGRALQTDAIFVLH